MTETNSAASPWNKGKITGPKPPLRPSHGWANVPSWIWRSAAATWQCSISPLTASCAAATSLRCASLTWHPNGYAMDSANVRQRTIGTPVRFELTEPTRQAPDDYLRLASCKPGDYLFPGRQGSDRPLAMRQYARLVSKWVGSIGLDPRKFATHSLRRYQSDVDLLPYRKPACGPTFAVTAHRSCHLHSRMRRQIRSGLS